MIRRAFNIFKDFFRDMNTYFVRSERSITEKNISALKVVSLGGTIMLLIFILVTPYLIEGWQPTNEYWGMIPTMLVFTAFIFIYSRFDWASFYIIQVVCVALCVMLLFHLTLISIYPYPGDPQSFLTVMFIILPVVFIVRPLIMDIIMLLTIVAYYFLASGVKEPTVLSHDMFAAVMSFSFSQIVMGVVYSIRLSDFRSGEQYKLQSRTDFLTGLLNRGSFETACSRKLRSAEEEKPCSLFLFDIKGLVEINETHGHAAGDRALGIVAESLKNAFRSSDIVGRIGHDDFCAFIDSTGDERFARYKAEAILSSVAGRAERDLGFSLNVCCGIAIMPTRSIMYSNLLSAATAALAESEPLDGRRITIATPEIEEE